MRCHPIACRPCLVRRRRCILRPLSLAHPVVDACARALLTAWRDPAQRSESEGGGWGDGQLCEGSCQTFPSSNGGVHPHGPMSSCHMCKCACTIHTASIHAGDPALVVFVASVEKGCRSGPRCGKKSTHFLASLPEGACTLILSPPTFEHHCFNNSLPTKQERQCVQ